MKQITYYAAAMNPDGKIGQLLVTRVVDGLGNLISKRQDWTGVTYRTEREMRQDLTRRNCR
jgi:hypothetical protein